MALPRARHRRLLRAAATAKAEDVQAAKTLLDGLGRNAKYKLPPGGVLTEIVVQDGSALSPDNIALFGKLTDLEKLQIYNFRSLNDEMAAQLAGLSKLTSLALTNSVINDPTVEMIAKSFPNLTDLDLSSNTNMTSSVMKVICGLSKLQRLTLVQNRFNDVGTRRLVAIGGPPSAGPPRQHGSGGHDHGSRGRPAETDRIEAPQHGRQRFRHGVPEQEPDAGFAADAGLRRHQPVGTTPRQTPETDAAGDLSVSGVRVRRACWPSRG